MPVISRFYGLVIKMYFLAAEHNPPHIHIAYDDREGVLDIQTLQMIESRLPSKAEAMAMEWAKIHQEELLAMWKTQNIHKLPPLE